MPNPDITDATNSKIYTPLIEVAQSTEGWSAPRKLQVAAQYLGLRGVDATILRYEVRGCAHAKAARDDPDGLPLRCVCVEVYCVELRRT